MEFLNELYSTLVKSAPLIITAVIVFAVGMGVAYLLNKAIRKALERSRIDRALVTFLLPIIKITLYVIVGIIALSTAGVPTATLLAAFGAVGLAVSLAVKDSLANMAGGILLLASKPFTIGDAVEVDGATGVVQSISILYTQINTFDNRAIMVPNGQISSDRIINMSREDKRRLDLVFDISYRDDPEQAKKIIWELVEHHKFALKDPLPIIRVCELADSSVKIACNVWVEGANLLTLKFDLLESVKQAFDQAGIRIPFPQLDVHFDPAAPTGLPLRAESASTRPERPNA
ncbi:MAG: mechanosensitive ion channel family protein [Oscillospiraceae bacterium]|jgi:small conductance mechanosensitive channel